MWLLNILLCGKALRRGKQSPVEPQKCPQIYHKWKSSHSPQALVFTQIQPLQRSRQATVLRWWKINVENGSSLNLVCWPGPWSSGESVLCRETWEQDEVYDKSRPAHWKYKRVWGVVWVERGGIRFVGNNKSGNKRTGGNQGPWAWYDTPLLWNNIFQSLIVVCLGTYIYFDFWFIQIYSSPLVTASYLIPET